MELCQDHWDSLREALVDRGLGGFIPDEAEQAARQFADLVQNGGKPTVDNYDPLIAANLAIMDNSLRVLSNAGGSGIAYLLAESDELDPCDLEGAEPGQMWPKCPLCYLNLAHKLTCTEDECKRDRERGFDDFIENAARDQEEVAENLS